MPAGFFYMEKACGNVFLCYICLREYSMRLGTAKLENFVFICPLRSPFAIFARKKTTMGVIRRCWIWLKRFRHRCGYGVHSPFAFDFLTNVVYERGEYYAYRALREQFFSSSGWRNGHALKCCKFLFRLANYVHPSVIRIYGGPVGRDVEEYLRAGCPSALFRHEGIGCDREGLVHFR